MGGTYYMHNNVNLFYTVEGSGDPVLLIHGWACDQSDWIFQVPFLLDHGFQVIALDQRGHGRSSPGNKYDPETLADDAAALLTHLGIGSGDGKGKPAIVIGHSLGGVVASELAFRHSALVRAVVLVDAAYYAPASRMEQVIAALHKSPDAASEVAATIFTQGDNAAETPAWLLGWRRRRTWAMPANVVTTAFEQLAAFLRRWETGVEYMKERKSVPRLVTCTEQKKADAEREIGLNEVVDRVEIIAAGHWAHQAVPDRFNAVVERWFRERGYLPTSSD